MSKARSLDYPINRFGFWSVIVVVVTAVVSMFFPLDVPGGYNAEYVDRVAWLSANRGTFIAAWVNQIAAMFSLSAALACGAWVVARKKPLHAILAALFVAMATMAFIIPKFIAVWTIPQLADAITTGAVGAELADPLLRLLNVSIPFSLYTSFDYLGFWLCGERSVCLALRLECIVCFSDDYALFDVSISRKIYVARLSGI